MRPLKLSLNLMLPLLFFFIAWLPPCSVGRVNNGLVRVRCELPDNIPNASYRLRRNNMMLRVTCNVGFQLQGYRLISCMRGKWAEEKPVCASMSRIF